MMMLKVLNKTELLMSISGRAREKRKTAVGIDVSKCGLERDFLISKAATPSLLSGEGEYLVIWWTSHQLGLKSGVLKFTFLT